MKLTIGNQVLTISIAETNQGGEINVTTERGEWTATPYYNIEGVETDDDKARMLFTALAGVGEAESYPSYRAWCDYMEHVGDEDTDENRYNQYRELLAAWEDISDTPVNDVLQYLADNYDI